MISNKLLKSQLKWQIWPQLTLYWPSVDLSSELIAFNMSYGPYDMDYDMAIHYLDIR